MLRNARNWHFKQYIWDDFPHCFGKPNGNQGTPVKASQSYPANPRGISSVWAGWRDVCQFEIMIGQSGGIWGNPHISLVIPLRLLISIQLVSTATLLPPLSS